MIVWAEVDSHWMNQALQMALFRRILSLHSKRRPLKDFHLGDTILPLQDISILCINTHIPWKENSWLLWFRSREKITPSAC